MQKLLSSAFLFFILATGLSGAASAQGTTAPTPPPAPARAENTSTADHTSFEALKQDFASGPEVTAACLSCHTEADDQVMHSIHYTWSYESSAGQELGKSNVINSFCGNVVGNEARCTSCHVGYGWTDMNTPPAEAGVVVDCLACHDRSGQYTKAAAGAGNPPLDPVAPGTPTITGKPAWPVDLKLAAQSVGLPGRDNCGNCHFYGGGGDNVKHGDLSSVLYNPPREIDVHMSPDGENFTCSTCHVSEQHQWPGSRYDVHASDPEGTGKPGERRDVATCESCHSTQPHEMNLLGIKLNDHTDVLACTTCHVPEFARGGVATKTLWDWSEAGKMGPDGKPMHEDNYVQGDGKALHTYFTMKGRMEWGEDVEPYYAWFDGQVQYVNNEREIDPSGIVDVNIIDGSSEDGVSRIWPFKRMEGRQAYDAGNNRLVYTHLFGPGTDTAFWGNFDWPKAIEAGMKAAGAEYSGEFGWVDTYMYWPVTHMVAPAEQALGCADCHSEGGRMAGLSGIYVPGSTPNSLVGTLGKLIVVLTLLGVVGHGLLRMFTGKKGGAK